MGNKSNFNNEYGTKPQRKGKRHGNSHGHGLAAIGETDEAKASRSALEARQEMLNKQLSPDSDNRVVCFTITQTHDGAIMGDLPKVVPGIDMGKTGSVGPLHRFHLVGEGNADDVSMSLQSKEAQGEAAFIKVSRFATREPVMEGTRLMSFRATSGVKSDENPFGLPPGLGLHGQNLPRFMVFFDMKQPCRLKQPQGRDNVLALQVLSRIFAMSKLEQASEPMKVLKQWAKTTLENAKQDVTDEQGRTRRNPDRGGDVISYSGCTVVHPGVVEGERQYLKHPDAPTPQAVFLQQFVVILGFRPLFKDGLLERNSLEVLAGEAAVAGSFNSEWAHLRPDLRRYDGAPISGQGPRADWLLSYDPDGSLKLIDRFEEVKADVEKKFNPAKAAAVPLVKQATDLQQAAQANRAKGGGAVW